MSGRARLALAALLLASAARFALEAWAISARCCDDFPEFWAAAERYAGGGALYAAPIQDFHPGSSVFKFPPFYAAALLAVRRLGFGPGATALHFAAQLAFYLLAVETAVRGLGLSGARRILVWAAALNFGPFFETLYGLQAETPILLLATASAALLARGRDAPAGGALGLAAGLKLYPGLLILVPAVLGRGRAVFWAVAAGAGSVAVGMVAFGAGESAAYFLRILPFMALEMPAAGYGAEGLGLASFLVETPGGHFTLLALPGPWGRAVADAVSSGVLALSLGLAARPRAAKGSALPAWAGLGLAVAATLPALPNSWANYQLLLMLPLAVAIGLARWSSLPLALSGLGFALTAGHQNLPAYFTLVSFPPDAFEAWQTARALAPFLCWLSMAWLLRSPASRVVSPVIGPPSRPD